MEVEGCARRRNQSDSKPERDLTPVARGHLEGRRNKWTSLRSKDRPAADSTKETEVLGLYNKELDPANNLKELGQITVQSLWVKTLPGKHLVLAL